MIGSKFSRHFFNQSEVKPKPIVAHAYTFSRALCRLRAITSSFDWFAGLSPSFLIGQSNYFGFNLRHSIDTRSITLDGWFVLSFEFGATVLGSTFESKPLPCHCRATVKPTTIEFGTAVARRLEQALVYRSQPQLVP